MKIRTITCRRAEFLFVFLISSLGVLRGQAGGGSASTQENVTTLRVNVDLVLLQVAVVDSKGKPMAGLKKEDFRIFQDDKEQQIAAFDAVNEETDKSTLPSSLSDIDESTQRGKVVLLLFDQGTISSANSWLALDSAERYVRRHMHPYDLMGVAVYLQSLKITCPLTHDAAKVIDAIRHANTAFAGAVGLKVQGTTGAKELRSQAVELFRSLKSLCTVLEPVRGRKTILLFTEDLSAPTDVLADFNTLVAEARKSDTYFFTLDTRGRSASSSGTASELDAISARQRPDSARQGVDLSQFQNQTNATILRSLAAQTNGYPIYNTDNLAEALDQVDLELGHYYILGFQSGTARSDGKTHKIEVKLNLKDARLKYRNTYTNPHPTDPLAGSKTENPLRDALLVSTPTTQVPLSFRPGFFFESPQVAQIPVFVKIGRGSITLRKKEGQWIGKASIMGVALEENGATASRFSGEINVAIDNAQAKNFGNQDLVYRNFFRLRPGKYHLKLVVMDEKGKTGTAEEHLLVPKLNEGAMSASSLILSQDMVPLPGLIKELKPSMLSEVDPLQFRAFQIYVPVDFVFDRQQPIIALYRVYAAAGANAMGALRAEVQAVDENGGIHTYPPIDLASSAAQVSQTETAVGFILPCRDLKSGKYHLLVKSIESASGQWVTSEADFQLRGSAQDPVMESPGQRSSEQAKPASAPVVPAAQMTGDEWAPPDIDHAVHPLTFGPTCSLPDVLSGAGKRTQELIHNINRFAATEVLEHQDVDHKGVFQTPEILKFDYMVSIQEVRGGLMSVEEFRNRDFSPLQLPGRLATIGTPSAVLIFHPRYIPDFDMVCEGLGDWAGRPAWLVRFEQRKDRPNNIRSYSIGGIRYNVRLRGRAWIDADTYEIVRLETDLADPIAAIQLRLEHMRIEYQPVDFPERKVQLWLPKSAELFLDFHGHRIRRRHYFTDFKLFSVETQQQIAPPKGGGSPNR